MYTNKSLHYSQLIYNKIVQENSIGEIVLTQLDNYVGKKSDISLFPHTLEKSSKESK